MASFCTSAAILASQIFTNHVHNYLSIVTTTYAVSGRISTARLSGKVHGVVVQTKRLIGVACQRRKYTLQLPAGSSCKQHIKRRIFAIFIFNFSSRQNRFIMWAPRHRLIFTFNIPISNKITKRL